MSGRSLWAVPLLLGVCLAAHGQDFEKIRLQAQKLEGEVAYAMAQARILEKVDPTKARDMLRDVLLKLEDTSVLPEKDRRALVVQVSQRIESLTKIIQARRVVEDPPKGGGGDRPPDKKFRPDPGGFEKPPTGPKGGPGDLAKGKIDSAKGVLDTHARLKVLRERGIPDAMLEVYRSAASTTEVRVTQAYLDRMAIRQPKLTKEETAALKALNSVLTPMYDKTPMKDIFKEIMDKTGVPIVVDKNSLAELQIDYNDEKVDFELPTKVSVRTVLKKILGERGLSYVVRDGIIHVVSAAKAREMMVTRTYPVSDLVAPDPRWGPFWGQAIMQQNAQALIAIIQGSIDPEIWNTGQPGGASIQFHAPTLTLIVRAPAEIHLRMGFSATPTGR